jgi:hypothetical protein
VAPHRFEIQQDELVFPLSLIEYGVRPGLPFNRGGFFGCWRAPTHHCGEKNGQDSHAVPTSMYGNKTGLDL